VLQVALVTFSDHTEGEEAEVYAAHERLQNALATLRAVSDGSVECPWICRAAEAPGSPTVNTSGT